MTLSHRIAAVLARTGCARWLSDPGPLILMYHGIGGSDGVPVDDFCEQLALLEDRRKVVSLEEAVGALGTPRASRVAAITFDDGYVDFLSRALPELARRAMHATLFVPAGLLGQSNVWDRGSAARRDILDESALRDLDPHLASIGAHGFSHRRLRGLTARELHVEVVQSRLVLEDVCRRSVRHFAYPYGQREDFDAAAVKAVRSAGYATACSSCFGRGNTPAGRYELRRVGIEPGDTLAVVERKLDGYYDWIAVKEKGAAMARRIRTSPTGRNRA